MMDTNGLVVAPGESLYVQPYINKPSDKNTNDVFVYASSATEGDPYASLVFDHDEGVWYKKKSGGITVNKSWSTMKNIIHNSNEWEKLTPTT